jgi:uncharacterized protein
MLKIVFLAYLVLLASSRTGLAAGFDCAMASAEFDKFVCSNPTLSSLDGEMGSTYTATLEKLSPEGVQLVRVGQRGWLKMARQSCPLETWGSSKDMRGARVACFEQLYRERIEEIKASAVKVGPFLFSRVDKVQAVMVDHPDPDDAAMLAAVWTRA